MPIKISPMELAKLILLVLVGVVVFYGAHQVLEWKAGAEQNVTRGRTLETTSAILSDTAELDSNTTDVEQGIAHGRATYEENKRNDVQNAARDAHVVPDSVRNRARERRLERERLGCAAGWVAEGCGAQGPPER